MDPMREHGTQFVFKGKREHIAKVKIPSLTYPKLNLILKYHMI